jgi:hypothetical protein
LVGDETRTKQMESDRALVATLGRGPRSAYGRRRWRRRERSAAAMASQAGALLASLLGEVANGTEEEENGESTGCCRGNGEERPKRVVLGWAGFRPCLDTYISCWASVATASR